MQKQLLKHNLHSQSLQIKRELKLKKRGAAGKNLKWHLLKTALQIFLWPLEKSSGFYVLIDISPRAWRITIRGLWCFQAKRFWPLWNSQVEIKTLQNTFEEVLDSDTNYFCCNRNLWSFCTKTHLLITSTFYWMSKSSLLPLYAINS